MLDDLRREPSNYFENFCRMSATDFELLLSKIGPVIAKKDKNMRKNIPIQERLAVTLRFLATGNSFQSPSTCLNFHHKQYLDVYRMYLPNTPDEWRKVAQEFKKQWDFPHCLGAIDGKHIIIEVPISTGTEFFHYKGIFSIVLMALVNANYEFIYVDVGCQGRISDGGVYRFTTLYHKLHKNELNLPPDEPLTLWKIPLAYVFVGDDAFALSTHMLKPYAGVYDKECSENPIESQKSP
ncbi:uncharacterized protein LOC126265673 [Aethina tumida]|uniref:uncharacterized protein LOC126265673 n=1 Tax=Aethina tumida TaxID=116153 RepID=UPI002149166A|nr:uncharacterized protein LOC126265673 [Aethina tumida]